MASLLIDAGNTRIKWGILNDQGVIASRGFLLTSEAAVMSEGLQAFLPMIDRALYVSVASDLVNRHIESMLEEHLRDAWHRFVPAAEVAGVANDYADPSQLGADRLVAAIGAWARIGKACLVVNCGTATTVDIVVPNHLQKKEPNATFRHDTAAARFSGGIILPGLSLMKSSLYRNTARLPEASGKFADIPDNTLDAIETGCLLAQVGAIEAMARQFNTAVPVVLSGGAASLIAGLLRSRGFTVIEAPELVLEGLSVAILQRFS